MMNNKRESNGELLRLLCMLMIVIHHFVVHALYPNVLNLNVIGHTWDNHVLLFTHCFFFIGVNCFVLLSGYYSIRLKPKSVINLWAIIVFYALLKIVEKWIGLSLRGAGDVFIWNNISQVLLPFSHTTYWFIMCYIALMLLSPLLNAAIDTFDKRQYQRMLLFISIMCVYFGYTWKLPNMNDSGYTTLQFVWLYLIGGYLRNYCTTDWMQRNRWRTFGVYIGCSLLWGVLTLLKSIQPITNFRVPFWHPFTYNNPLVMGGCIGFFLFVMSFSFKSRLVNWLSTSVLAVYLVQEGVFHYHWLIEWGESWTPMVKILMLPLFSIVFLFAILLLDKGRQLLMKPFWKWYDKRLSPCLSKFGKRLK